MPPRTVRATPLRPSACPGLLRIVAARDGGICRVKLAGGKLSSAQARVLADSARRHASGVIEATNRANLQIRGVRVADQPALIEALLGASLGPRNAAADDIRNLMSSPLAGLDPATRFNSTPLVGRLLALLETRPRLQELSAKFAILVDGGEALAMREHPHDIWLAAIDTSASPLLAFGLAGCPSPQATLGLVSVAQAEELVAALLGLFLDLATPEQTRMRHLLDTLPVTELLAQLAERLSFRWGPSRTWTQTQTPRNGHIGIHPQRQPGLFAVGSVAPLARLDAHQLEALAGLAERYSDGQLRFTPWQSVLFANVRAEEAPEVLVAMSELGLLGQPRQALAQMLACTGSAGCAKGLADTKADGLLLAAYLQRRGLAPRVHLSGCVRSCAAAHCADTTLLATAPGHYDLYQRDASQPGFGKLRAHHLSLEQISDLLAADSLPAPFESHL